MIAAHSRWLFTAALFTCSAAIAQPTPATSSWYAGGAIGRLHLDFDFSGQIASSPNPVDGIPPTDARAGLSEKQGGRVFLGYRLTPRFAFEFDYLSLGKVETSYRNQYNLRTAFFIDRQVAFGRNFNENEATHEVRGYGLSAAAMWPMGERLSLLGRAGVARTQLRFEQSTTVNDVSPDLSTNPPGAIFTALGPSHRTSFTRDQTRPVLALGLDYRISDRWNVRAEWARYFGIGRQANRSRLGDSGDAQGKFDIDLVSAGLTFSF